MLGALVVNQRAHARAPELAAGALAAERAFGAVAAAPVIDERGGARAAVVALVAGCSAV